MQIPNLDDIHAWLDQAPRGSRICYHTGLLAPDRFLIEYDGTRFTYTRLEPIDTIAALMMRAALRNRVVLYQHKIKPNQFQYWAKKRNKR